MRDNITHMLNDYSVITIFLKFILSTLKNFEIESGIPTIYAEKLGNNITIVAAFMLIEESYKNKPYFDLTILIYF